MEHCFTVYQGLEKHYIVIYCRKCGYVAFYANDPDTRMASRQAHLPPTCIPAHNQKDPEER